MMLGRRVKLATAISFVVMLLVNYGANAFRLNGMTTADVSGIYQTPLTPAGYTFAIWGLIYTLLLLHVLFACGLFKAGRPSLTAEDADRIEKAFVISSLANGAWILAWQYLLIPLSLILLVVIFACRKTVETGGSRNLLVHCTSGCVKGTISAHVTVSRVNEQAAASALLFVALLVVDGGDALGIMSSCPRMTENT